MKRISDFICTSRREVSADSVALTLKPADEALCLDFLPGQFVNVQIPGRDVLLRRPISVAMFAEGLLTLIVRNSGKGTQILCSTKPNDLLNIIHPLGNSFPIEDVAGKKVVLVGGGIGSAPLLYYGAWLKDHGAKMQYVLGARSEELLVKPELFQEIAPAEVFTDNGTAGRKGLVTDSGYLKLGDYDFCACCGPEPMMRAVATLLSGTGKECYVSLENTMACGIGACLCCVTETRRGNKCVCTEGPVFNVKDLAW